MKLQVGNIVSLRSAYTFGHIGDVAEVVGVTKQGVRVHLYTAFGEKSERPVDANAFRLAESVVRVYDTVEEAFQHRRASNTLRRAMHQVHNMLEKTNLSQDLTVQEIEDSLNEFYRQMGLPV